MSAHLVARGMWGHMVALRGTEMIGVPIDSVVHMNTVDPHGEMVDMAKGLGITFGAE
jgi:hypothetical protein